MISLWLQSLESHNRNERFQSLKCNDFLILHLCLTYSQLNIPTSGCRDRTGHQGLNRTDFSALPNPDARK